MVMVVRLGLRCDAVGSVDPAPQNCCSLSLDSVKVKLGASAGAGAGVFASAGAGAVQGSRNGPKWARIFYYCISLSLFHWLCSQTHSHLNWALACDLCIGALVLWTLSCSGCVCVCVTRVSVVP